MIHTFINKIFLLLLLFLLYETVLKYIMNTWSALPCIHKDIGVPV